MTILVVVGIIVLSMVLTLMIGLARETEYLFSFEIKGKVIDDVSNLGIEGVQIIFIDTSLDYRRSNTPHNYELSIGSSNPDGSIDLRFEYWWGRLESWIRSPSPFGSSIEFRVTKSGYQAKSVIIDPRTRPLTGDIVEIDLGSVRLFP